MDLSQRKARITELLDRLTNGEDVARRDMKAVLSEEQFAAMQAYWDEQKQFRADAKDKPAEVMEYERRLNKAMFDYNKAEGYSGSTHREQVRGMDGKRTAKRAYDRAETGFERLIEWLEERLTADPSLGPWFDRTIVFGLEGNLAPNPDEMPRVVTSRSRDRVGDGWLVGKQTKRDVKRRVLDEALADIVAAEELAARIAARIAEEEAKAEVARREAQQALRKIARGRHRT